MDLLERMRTTLRARASTRRPSPSPNPLFKVKDALASQGEPVRALPRWLLKENQCVIFRVGFSRRTSACSSALASQGEPATVFVEFENKPEETSEGSSRTRCGVGICSDVGICSKITLSSRDSHGYASFSGVLRRASEYPDVPVMFASSRERRRGLLAATCPSCSASVSVAPTSTSASVSVAPTSASASVRPIKVLAFKLPLNSSLD